MNNGMLHLQARRRLFKHLEPFPSRSAFKRSLDYCMYGIAIVQPLALIPQALATYASSDGNASPLTWGLLGIIGCFWILYGIVHKERPIIITNCLSVILDFVIVYGILR
jgi:uncharacterized protein with PQ loop repeat